MLSEKAQAFLERMILHRRFYLPAAVCLFLSYPGGLAALLPGGFHTITLSQRIETLLLALPTSLVLSLIIISSLPRARKLQLSAIAFVLPLFLTTLLLRTSPFIPGFHYALLRKEVFLHLITGFVVFLLLCFMDSKKRARSILLSLLFLMLPLTLFSGLNRDSIRFFDQLRYDDVLTRMDQREYPGEHLVQQCLFIADPTLRLNCNTLVTKPLDGVENCDESGGVNDCMLSRREHVGRRIANHPPSK